MSPPGRPRLAQLSLAYPGTHTHIHALIHRAVCVSSLLFACLPSCRLPRWPPPLLLLLQLLLLLLLPTSPDSVSACSPPPLKNKGTQTPWVKWRGDPAQLQLSLSLRRIPAKLPQYPTGPMLGVFLSGSRAALSCRAAGCMIDSCLPVRLTH